MRHLIILLALPLLAALPASAQKGLHVNEIFDGDVVRKTYMVENLIKGEQLKPYKLTFFRSIKFKATAEERRKIEALVNEDIKNSLDLEQERQGEADKIRKGDVTHALQAPLNYAMMTLPPDGKWDPNRPNNLWYLCYQCTPVRNEYAITLVFMKGNASIKELEKMFRKN